jgi:hypothetical protein
MVCLKRSPTYRQTISVMTNLWMNLLKQQITPGRWAWLCCSTTGRSGFFCLFGWFCVCMCFSFLFLEGGSRVTSSQWKIIHSVKKLTQRTVSWALLVPGKAQTMEKGNKKHHHRPNVYACDLGPKACWPPISERGVYNTEIFAFCTESPVAFSMA